jgi:hypothetical protein
MKDILANRFIEYNLYNFKVIDKTYGLRIVDQFAIHSIDQYKRFGDNVMRPKLTVVERQLVNEIAFRIANHWDLFKMIFDDDKEYQQAIGKAYMWCKELRKHTANGPKNYHDLTKVFLACESFMLAMDDYYSVEHFKIP